ncbi:c-type cytochrome biogenesis protein CcmI [Albirhodobacter sp. R86504]|uniref:c-type cytochrome biogenesis protein CcmI n=1 Tax=Albirhodobacter sp. R86504 TaxID=3093848 RepID=UPI0036704D7D
MLFWIVTAALTAIIAAALALAALRALRADRDEGDAPHPDRSDLGVYRAQLAEVDRDLARGILQPAEAERSRTEIKRRILEADRSARKSTRPRTAPRAALLTGGGLIAALLLGSFALYARLGSAGYADQPIASRLASAQALYASRPSQETAEREAAKTRGTPPENPELEALVAQLRTAMEQRPDAIEGLQLLAQNEEILGNYRAAWQAQDRLIAAKQAAPDTDPTADDYAGLADLMIISAGGFVSPEAEGALLNALNLDPNNPPARFYAGMMMIQNGRPDQSFALWSKLLAEGPENAPWIAPIRSSINELAWLAGEPNYIAPPAIAPPAGGSMAPLPGPDADAVAAASDLTQDERDEMVQGMVNQLAARLQAEGGNPQEWARLIAALTVLGDIPTRDAAITSAKSAYPGQADLFDQAAKGASQ